MNDERFARMFTEDRRGLDGWGSERIRQALRSRGIDPELLEAAMADDQADGTAAEAEIERALELLRRRFPAAPAGRRDRDRALGVLLRKGYEGEIALQALSSYAREE